MDRRISIMDFDELQLGKEEADAPGPRHKAQAGIPVSPLDELLSHWDGTHRPDPGVQIGTKGEAQATFRDYRRALGEDLKRMPGLGGRYVRSHQPEKKAILWFVAAYLMLRKGERARAARHLHDLTRLYPNFPDPWVWLTATTDDPAQRIDYLENAVVLEPAHPLARDALSIAQGRVSPQQARQDRQEKEQIEVSKCPKCGGGLHYVPGATEVACQYCGRRLLLRETNLINQEARLVGDLQLQRRLRGHTWREVQRVVHCQACGAELTMTGYLSKQCVFCGSTSVLVEDSHQRLEQPDGFLPFKLDEAQAAAVIDQAQRSTSQRLKRWWTGQEQVIQGLQAVYLPFWVFDGFVEVRRRSKSDQPYPGAHLDGSLLSLDRTRMRGFSVSVQTSGRTGHPLPGGEPALSKETMMFDNLVFSAMDFPPPWILKKVQPYKLRSLVPYEAQLLANWPAALYQRDVEVAAREAYNSMLTSALWRKRSVVAANAAELGQLRRMFQVTTVTYQLVLLPVWAALARRDREQRLVLVNGQTGQVAFSSELKSGS
jgi:DNA-directed RNA polymerase subunit RPC12/RpoP